MSLLGTLYLDMMRGADEKILICDENGSDIDYHAVYKLLIRNTNGTSSCKLHFVVGYDCRTSLWQKCLASAMQTESIYKCVHHNSEKSRRSEVGQSSLVLRGKKAAFFFFF